MLGVVIFDFANLRFCDLAAFSLTVHRISVMIVAVIYSTAGLMFSFYKITMDINVCRDSKFLNIEINLIGLITEGG